MATYSTNLALTLMATGEQSNTWGDTTNTNLGTLLEQAISGYVTQAITDGSSANTTITIPNGATGVARNMFIEMTGALTFSTTSLIVPANKKLYFIYNNTTGGFAVTVKVSGQTGVSVPNGKKMVLVSNGTDIVNAENYIASLSVGALTSGRVPYAGTSGLLQDSANLTFNGTTLTAAGFSGPISGVITSSSITDSGLTSGRVTYAGTAGLLQDSANLTFNGTTLTANTIGAFTLSGTVAGGGNQLNNVIIGTTTPLAGAFTTLSATGDLTLSGTVGRVVSDANSKRVLIAGGSTAATTTGAYAIFEGYDYGGAGAGGAISLVSAAGTTNPITMLVGGTTRGVFSTTGLAVTGTLSATLDATIYGVTVGRGGGAVSTNTAVGSSALNANTSGVYNTAMGRTALLTSTSSYCTAIGAEAGYSNTTGLYLTAVGAYALYGNTTGQGNSALGVQAVELNTTGSFNTGIGRFALRSNTTASNNTAVGYQAGYSNTTGSNNTMLGNQAGFSATTGVITAVGSEAAYSANGGDYVVAVGYQSLRSNTTGDYNTAIGTQALFANTTASNNTAVGYQALYANTTGAQNTAVGGYAPTIAGAALQANTTGSYNVAMGTGALNANTTASNNTAVGYQAGYNRTTGVQNTFVGSSSGFTGTTAAGNTFIGYGAGYYSTGTYNTFVGCGPTNGAGDSMTTGTKNTIVGAYSGNQGGLDIRTASNYVVLSDGDGNVRGTFDSSGNLLVGITSGSDPESLGSPYLNVKGAVYAFKSSDTTKYVAMGAAGTAGYLIAQTGLDSLRIYAGGSERARIDSSGNLGIGTSSPFTRLESAAARATTLNSIASFNTMAASVTDTTAFAVGVGGGINFRAQLTASTYSTYASIWSFRENATTNDYRGSLIFGTADNGDGYPEERARINSSGNLLLGNSTDPIGSNRLLVQSAATANDNRTMSVYNTTATSATAFANKIFQLSSNGSGADVTLQFTDQTAYNANIGMGSGALYFATNGATERMRIDASGNLLVGGTAVGNGGKLYVNGSISLGTSTTGAQSSMAKDTTQLTTSISTSATTIYTDIASGMSSASAGYFIIYGSNNAGAGFMDVVIAKASGTPVVVSSSTVEGSPAARTYSVSSYALQLTMASGTYSVNLKATVLGYPF